MSEDNEVKGSRFKLDGTVHLGHVFIIVSFIISASIAYSSLENDISGHEWRLQRVESSIQEQNRVNGDVKDSLFTIGRDVAVIKKTVDRMEGMPAR